MRFQQIDEAFKVCKRHNSEALKAGLDSFQIKQIEHYLVRAMVLLIISNHEEYIERMFVRRAEKAGDSEISSLVSKFVDKEFRSPNLGKISGMLRRLSDSCYSSFHGQVEGKEPEIKAAWDSLLAARQAIVHRSNGGSVPLTWTDLEGAYEKSLRVLQALANALALSKKDLSGL